MPKPTQIKIEQRTGFEVSFEYTDKKSNYRWPADPAANYLVCSWIYRLSQLHNLESLFNYKIDGYQDFAHHEVSLESFHHLPQKLIDGWKGDVNFDELMAQLGFVQKKKNKEELVYTSIEKGLQEVNLIRAGKLPKKSIQKLLREI